MWVQTLAPRNNLPDPINPIRTQACQSKLIVILYPYYSRSIVELHDIRKRSSRQHHIRRRMLQLRPRIAKGDLVIVYENYTSMSAVRVCPPQTFWSQFGEFPHASMLGKQFGQRLNTANGKNFVYLLSPSAELWTETLQHRTQILYIADISMIVLQLEV